jgi:hypothetical protein
MPDSAERDAILCYGHDEMLLLTRKRVLEIIGIPVSTVSTAAQYRAKLSSTHPAVILLCQSLPHEECAAATAFAEVHSPDSKVLIMYGGPGKCELAGADAEFDWGDGPAALLSTVKQLISASARERESSVRSSALRR